MKPERSRLVTVVGIRLVRVARGWSVQDLVDRIYETSQIEVHGDTIRNIELGHKRGSLRLMNAWAKALRVDPLDVFVVPEDALVAEAAA